MKIKMKSVCKLCMKLCVDFPYTIGDDNGTFMLEKRRLIYSVSFFVVCRVIKILKRTEFVLNTQKATVSNKSFKGRKMKVGSLVGDYLFMVQ
jgi:hypothetical protein